MPGRTYNEPEERSLILTLARTWHCPRSKVPSPPDTSALNRGLGWAFTKGAFDVLVIENVQDFPRPPALGPAGARLRAVFNGLDIADTQNGLRVLETHHAPTYYIPPSDVVTSALVPTKRETFCEYKGHAVYFDLVINGRRARNAAWSYPAPTNRFSALRDHIAFYATSVDAAYVGQVRVMPQPGDFYGGWVTPNLTGDIKGAHGTMHW